MNTDSLCLVAICSTVEKCLTLAAQDGATEEQIKELRMNSTCMPYDNANAETYMISEWEVDPDRVDD